LPCLSWFDDQSDNELLDLLVVLNRLADSNVDNVIKELQRASSEPYEEVVEKPTAHDSVSDSENEEVTGSVESENEGEVYEDEQNGPWKAMN